MKPGLYEELMTTALRRALDQLGDPRLIALAGVEHVDAHSVMAQYFEHLLAAALARYRGADAAEKQSRLVERLLHELQTELESDSADRISIATPLERLLAIHARPGESLPRPDTPLARSALLTGTRYDPSLGSQLKKEIASADRVDILCSFIKWSGLRVILDDLRALVDAPCDEGPRLRVITTSYMGATDPRAVEALSTLPHTEIRVSYDTKRTRLHAKAYLFHRETGFSSAYVGSANLSNAALSDGLEWTTKISHYELPYLWEKIAGTFETYWSDEEFDPYVGPAKERLQAAIAHERHSNQVGDSVTYFDLRPFPFQEEILDVIAAERQVQNKHRHLIVAATGTGKTMIAAFDYARLARAGRRPSLIFIAHREEILQQSLAAFRGVLRDQNFGDLLVGGRDPEQSTHLFCSIQTYNSRAMWQLPPEAFEYVVVDEFHHAAAASYQRLLSHIRPQVLLGLTATPERTDQLDILHWFDGRPSAEIRLPDAINRRLLCPFQYFGITDSVDLDGLVWQRGGYRTSDLERLYTSNDVRAELIRSKTCEIVTEPRTARGLGFCVSVAHAEYMAEFFTARGLPSLALTAESPDRDRRLAREQMGNWTINFLFVVDLFNEGVDIPEVDTILFLRPTESLTIYLQQFGRGLRLAPDKECLTILDFIGAQRREFRFANRFRAISTLPTAKIDEEIEKGLPHLPNGCVVHLERVAQQRILDNVRDSIRLVRQRLVNDLQSWGQALGRAPSLEEALNYFNISLVELLNRGTWSQLLADANLAPPPQGSNLKALAKGLKRMTHIDDARWIRALLDVLEGRIPHDAANVREDLVMWYVTLWGATGKGWSLDVAHEQLRQHPEGMAEVCAILHHLLRRAPLLTVGQLPELSGPLSIHAQYTRDEILTALGHWSLEQRRDFREGVLHIAARRVDAFFVTLQKSDADYSPTTMYEDYLIAHDRFHWQSQSTTSDVSATGRRYVGHAQMGYSPLLFVRENKTWLGGRTAPYTYFGPCNYASHTGSRPMSIIWHLRHPVPARLYRRFAHQVSA